MRVVQGLDGNNYQATEVKNVAATEKIYVDITKGNTNTAIVTVYAGEAKTAVIGTYLISADTQSCTLELGNLGTINFAYVTEADASTRITFSGHITGNLAIHTAYDIQIADDCRVVDCQIKAPHNRLLVGTRQKRADLLADRLHVMAQDIVLCHGGIYARQVLLLDAQEHKYGNIATSQKVDFGAELQHLPTYIGAQKILYLRADKALDLAQTQVIADGVMYLRTPKLIDTGSSVYVGKDAYFDVQQAVLQVGHKVLAERVGVRSKFNPGWDAWYEAYRTVKHALQVNTAYPLWMIAGVLHCSATTRLQLIGGVLYAAKIVGLQQPVTQNVTQQLVENVDVLGGHKKQKNAKWHHDVNTSHAVVYPGVIVDSARIDSTTHALLSRTMLQRQQSGRQVVNPFLLQEVSALERLELAYNAYKASNYTLPLDEQEHMEASLLAQIFRGQTYFAILAAQHQLEYLRAKSFAATTAQPIVLPQAVHVDKVIQAATEQLNKLQERDITTYAGSYVSKLQAILQAGNTLTEKHAKELDYIANMQNSLAVERIALENGLQACITGRGLEAIQALANLGTKSATWRVFCASKPLEMALKYNQLQAAAALLASGVGYLDLLEENQEHITPMHAATMDLESGSMLDTLVTHMEADFTARLAAEDKDATVNAAAFKLTLALLAQTLIMRVMATSTTQLQEHAATCIAEHFTNQVAVCAEYQLAVAQSFALASEQYLQVAQDMLTEHGELLQANQQHYAKQLATFVQEYSAKLAQERVNNEKAMRDARRKAKHKAFKKMGLVAIAAAITAVVAPQVLVANFAQLTALQTAVATGFISGTVTSTVSGANKKNIFTAAVLGGVTAGLGNATSTLATAATKHATMLSTAQQRLAVQAVTAAVRVVPAVVVNDSNYLQAFTANFIGDLLDSNLPTGVLAKVMPAQLQELAKIIDNAATIFISATPALIGPGNSQTKLLQYAGLATQLAAQKATVTAVDFMRGQNKASVTTDSARRIATINAQLAHGYSSGDDLRYKINNNTLQDTDYWERSNGVVEQQAFTAVLNTIDANIFARIRNFTAGIVGGFEKANAIYEKVCAQRGVQPDFTRSAYAAPMLAKAAVSVVPGTMGEVALAGVASLATKPLLFAGHKAVKLGTKLFNTSSHVNTSKVAYSAAAEVVGYNGSKVSASYAHGNTQSFQNPLKYSGSGPAPGVISINPNSKSFKALDNYNPKNGIEFVYDPERQIFAVGKVKNVDDLGLSPLSFHQKLAKSIGANENTVLGGTFSRTKDGTIKLTEHSGHYGKRWQSNDGARQEMLDLLSQNLNSKIDYTPWSKNPNKGLRYGE